MKGNNCLEGHVLQNASRLCENLVATNADHLGVARLGSRLDGGLPVTTRRIRALRKTTGSDLTLTQDNQSGDSGTGHSARVAAPIGPFLYQA